MKTFIESIELPNTNILTRRVKSKKEDMFGEDDTSMEETTLIKCEILKAGTECKKYKDGDFVLIKANHLRPILYTGCPSDIKVTYNEDLIWSKINE